MIPTPPHSETEAALLRDDRVQAVAAFRALGAFPDPAFDRLTALVKRLLDVPVALLSLVDADRQTSISDLDGEGRCGRSDLAGRRQRLRRHGPQ